jgi:phosphatidylinositol phospholipase C delta
MVYHHDPHSLEVFPSPQQLRNKILISRRPPKELLYANDDDGKVGVRNGVEIRQHPADPNYQSLVSFHVVEPRGMLQNVLTGKANKIQRPGWYETDIISFTQKRFLRTRPQRKLLIYAPYKPQRAWMHGAQLIALSRKVCLLTFISLCFFSGFSCSCSSSTSVYTLCGINHVYP